MIRASREFASCLLFLASASCVGERFQSLDEAPPTEALSPGADASQPNAPDVPPGQTSNPEMPLPESPDAGLSPEMPSPKPPEAPSVVCASGEGRCLGNEPQGCVNGNWLSQPACSGETPLCEGEGRCVCSEGTTRCENASFLTCEAGAWETTAACGQAESCTDKGCRCNEGAFRCLADGSSRETCSQGSWQFANECGDDLTCRNGSCVCGLMKPRCRGPRATQYCDAKGELAEESCSGATPLCDLEDGTCKSVTDIPGAVLCGDSACGLAEDCCIPIRTPPGGSGPPGPPLCVLKDVAHPKCVRDFAIRFACDSTSDCGAGEECCLGQHGAVTFRAACTKQGQCTSSNTRKLCDPLGDVESECGGRACVNLLFEPYSFLSECKR